jgi:nitric oxide reductase NorD protein
MAEAEDVIVDAARHATVFARELWKRHRPHEAHDTVALGDVAARLDLLITAVFGLSLRLRVAQPPAPETFVSWLFKRAAAPSPKRAVPATDGLSIWLPRDAGSRGPVDALRYFRCLALTQAARAHRGAAQVAASFDDPLGRSVFLLLEAHAVDCELATSLPGLAPELEARRTEALLARPPLVKFAPQRLALERFARDVLRRSTGDCSMFGQDTTPRALGFEAHRLAATLERETPGLRDGHGGQLYLDDWTGDLRPAGETLPPSAAASEHDEAVMLRHGPRSARLRRTPQVREPRPGEDDGRPGAWMVQTSQPHEHAEDPLGMQRPADRDDELGAEQHADSVADLAQARLVRTATHAKEVLLSDDGINHTSFPHARQRLDAALQLSYPEWDFRKHCYRQPGACVRLVPAELGPTAWVERTLREHATRIDNVRRRFQMLRARRVRVRGREDGDELDLEAYIEMHVDLRTGRPARQAVYQTQHAARRDAAIMVLVDTSGSTDSWVSEKRRVIDVEKEALILVCVALGELHDPFCVLSFSGESAAAVTLRTLKSFDEPYGATVAARIAALEPEAYTRAGAAIRHASTVLMDQPVRQRLLLLLSDGKPNDIDQYEGQYGVEDMRQAVIEAKLQGIHPFCLTVDRQAASYLPRIFGPAHYALLSRPELLPNALLEWLKQLVAA